MGCLYVCERSLVVCLVYELTDAGEGLMKNDVVEHTTDIMCCDVFCLRIDLHVCTKGTGYNMISRKVIRYQCEDEEEVELSFNGTVPGVVGDRSEFPFALMVLWLYFDIRYPAEDGVYLVCVEL